VPRARVAADDPALHAARNAATAVAAQPRSSDRRDTAADILA
jgi:hypothetical protein